MFHFPSIGSLQHRIPNFFCRTILSRLLFPRAERKQLRQNFLVLWWYRQKLRMAKRIKFKISKGVRTFKPMSKVRLKSPKLRNEPGITHAPLKIKMATNHAKTQHYAKSYAKQLRGAQEFDDLTISQLLEEVGSLTWGSGVVLEWSVALLWRNHEW